MGKTGDVVTDAFNFIGGNKDVTPDTNTGETATSGNLVTGDIDPTDDMDHGVDQSPSPPKDPKLFHQGLTKEQVLEAQRRAQSRSGLDVSAFMKESKLTSLDVDELLKLRIKE